MGGHTISAFEYHEATKHHFHRFARSLGYLDWSAQPNPFRRFDAAPLVELPQPASHFPSAPYDELFTGSIEPLPIDRSTIGSFLRYSLGLSAWKQYGSSRWALRVNPSSGNLHPTEAYIAWDRSLFHYAPREHALERRCAYEAALLPVDALLVGLTSIHWREAWKYGERAFRYCQHDAGHALAALRMSAAMHGWRLWLLDHWPFEALSAILGTDRDGDFENAEREEPGCIALVCADASSSPQTVVTPDPWVEAAQRGHWYGRANRLSSAHVEWPIIDAVAAATRMRGNSRSQVPHPTPGLSLGVARPESRAKSQIPDPKCQGLHSPSPRLRREGADTLAAQVIVQRRSALGYDPRGWLRRDAFVAMLERLNPGAPPWDATDWDPHVHLALFVHRVRDVTPGIYGYVRDPTAVDDLRGAMRSEFIWERVEGGLFLLAPVDTRATANRLSCNQEIAEEGFFSLGMIARFEDTLRERGGPSYRRLFWEAGMVGQVLYLEAEAAGARGTGIGCYFDDPVHELLGLTGLRWQSLYHFSIGLPLEDGRLTTEPGYAWEAAADAINRSHS